MSLLFKSSGSRLSPRLDSGPRAAHLWAIGGGKGGVGKSFISSSLAMCLGRLGKTVILVDLDLGGANLHTCLGVPQVTETLSDFISGRVDSLAKIVMPTALSNLGLISGSNDSLNIAELDNESRVKLIEALRGLPADYVVLDLGAGTSANTLEFFLAADQKIIACTPEPTAIENAYRFIKTCFYRKIRQAEGELGITDIIDAAMDSRNKLGIKSPADLVRHVSEVNPEAGHRLVQKINDFQISIIMNLVRTREDGVVGESMRTICRRYFGIEANYLGRIDHDNAVWQSLRKRRHLVIDYPYSTVVGQFLHITKQLTAPTSARVAV